MMSDGDLEEFNQMAKIGDKLEILSKEEIQLSPLRPPENKTPFDNQIWFRITGI